jgi:protein ImuB
VTIIMLWLYIDLPTLAIDLCERSSGKAMAIAITHASGRILMVNATAYAAGVRESQSISTACCLQADLLLKPRDELDLDGCLEGLSHWVYQYCANIALYPPDGLLLECGTMMRVHGNIVSLCEKLDQGLIEQGFQPSLSTGLSPLSSRILARAGKSLRTDCVKRIRLALDSTPITHCGLMPAITEKLQRMGFNQLGQLLVIPRTELASRFGRDICTWLSRLTGGEADPQHFYSPPLHFERTIELLAEIENSAGLLFPINRLLLDLEIFLRHAQKSVESITLKLHHRKDSSNGLSNMPLTSALTSASTNRHYSEIRIGVAASLTQAKEVLALVTLKLEQYRLPAAVMSVTLVANQLLAIEAPQDDLFSDSHFPDGNSLQNGHHQKQRLLQRFYAKLHEENIVRLHMQEDHRPEKSCQFETISRSSPAKNALSKNTTVKSTTVKHTTSSQTYSVKSQQSRNKQTSRANLPACKLTRPVWLLPHPSPVQVNAFRLISDAERISAGWWDEGINRDYYIARFPEGALGWVFRTGEGLWFLHGWFG